MSRPVENMSLIQPEATSFTAAAFSGFGKSPGTDSSKNCGSGLVPWGTSVCTPPIRWTPVNWLGPKKPLHHPADLVEVVDQGRVFTEVVHRCGQRHLRDAARQASRPMSLVSNRITPARSGDPFGPASFDA